MFHRLSGLLVPLVILSLISASGVVGFHTSSLRASMGEEGIFSAGKSSSGDPPGPRGKLPRKLLESYNSLINYSDVMVVRNLNSPISMEIADYFIQQRRIPEENVCNVSTSTVEVIDRATFNDLRAQIESNMTAHNLVDRINIIVTTKGIPLKISDSIFDQRRASVDSELALINDINSGSIGNLWWFSNPYFNASEPFSHQNYHIYIVTRLTGYTAEDAKSLVDRATQSIGRKGRFILDIDPRRDTLSGYKVGNDWMRIAYEILTSRGFEVFLDQNNTFLNNQTGLAGYSSWGSNDGNWYLVENTNGGFEKDEDGDQVPDGWFKTDNPGLSEVVRSSEDPQGTSSWCVKIFRSVANENYSAISQNFSLIPGRRYYLTGSANLTNVSGEKGVHLQIRSYDSDGNLMGTYNGSARSGTTSRYVGLGQVIYEPQPGALWLVISAILSKSSGTVYLDNVYLREIKPHNTWVHGAVGETYVSTGGRSFHYPTRYGQSLVADLIKDGITGIKGYVYEPYLTAVAHPDILFERYTSGYSLAESFAMASEISLSWMDLILGDPKVAPYNRSYLPDLSVEDANLTLPATEVMLGTNLTLSAVVENRGNFPTMNATASFILRSSSIGSLYLWNFTGTVEERGSVEVNFSWSVTELTLLGEYEICIMADPEDEFFELDEENNQVCRQIRISDGIRLRKGWNLISLPLQPFSTDTLEVLKRIEGEYDIVRYYDAWDSSDPWKMFSTSKPEGISDLRAINNEIGVWIHLLNETILPVEGSLQASVEINLHSGWNLIGYPSLTTRRVAEVFASLPLERLEGFSEGADPYFLREFVSSDFLSPGQGYWVKVSTDCRLRIVL
ncbi:MAG: TIGR03790 family protein [Thermoplasmata archaeon]